MSLCKYKDSLGIPNQGFHTNRIPYLDVALNDTLATIGGSIILSLIIKYFSPTNFLIIFIACTIFLFATGIIIHRIFCVNTTLNKSIIGII